jgi:aminoglycoside phosphotransferase (APT) family kinase protein
MANLLRRVHALPIPRAARRMTPADWVAHYRAALGALDSKGTAGLLPSGRTDPQALADSVLRRLARPESPVLCHSDLHRQNLAVDRELVLLDWEYAHVSDRRWDLAGWVANNDGAADFAAELLGEYRQRRATAPEVRDLMLHAWLYDYVCLLWSELYLCSMPNPSPDVDSRCGVLAARLLGLGTAGHGRAGQLPAH